jgi:hypothetical protein
MVVLLAATAALAGAAPAMADITTATVTAPSDPAFLQYDVNNADPQPFDVEGTSDGTTGDLVDIRCYDGAFGDFTDLATDVAVDADGAFSVPDADLSTCPQTLFRLRAVPAGADDVDTSMFAGPLFGNGYRNLSYDLDQPVGQQLYDYELKSVTAEASNDYSSVSSTGLAEGPLFDSDTTSHDGSWEGVDTLQNGGRDGEPGRSEITLDGHDVYTPRGAHDMNSGPLPAEMTVTSDAPDPATGELTIQETDPLVYCGDGSGDIADPASDTAPACPEFLPAPAQLVRTITESNDGLQSTIVDHFSATDAAPHALTLAYDNRLTHAAGNARFPGESTYSVHADGVTPSLGPDGHGAIFVEQNHGAPGPDNVQGAIAYATRPDRALVQVKTVDDSDQTTLQLQYTRTIPATGSAEVSQSYVQGFDRDDVATGANVPTDAAQGPSVAFTSPADGVGVTNDAVTVTGTAFDNGGLLSLAVGGLPTSVSPDGTWSQTITGLAAGTNTITVVARDHAGNTAQASVTVVYTPPETPPAQDDDAGTPPPAAPVVVPPVAPVVPGRALVHRAERRGAAVGRRRRGDRRRGLLGRQHHVDAVAQRDQGRGRAAEPCDGGAGPGLLPRRPRPQLRQGGPGEGGDLGDAQGLEVVHQAHVPQGRRQHLHRVDRHHLEDHRGRPQARPRHAQVHRTRRPLGQRRVHGEVHDRQGDPSRAHGQGHRVAQGRVVGRVEQPDDQGLSGATARPAARMSRRPRADQETRVDERRSAASSAGAPAANPSRCHSM